MRACILLFLALPAWAQFTMTLGPTLSYNDQNSGVNGWPNNGRHDDRDTTRACWSNDNKTYLTGNDGTGPQFSLTGGRNLFLTTLSDFINPAAGILSSVVNSMDDFGTITQLNTNGWTDGFSWKTGGVDCFNSKIIISAARQRPGAPYDGGNMSLIWSGDHGATWCNGEHTNHTTGVCTITPSATGDAPTSGAAQWDLTTNIYHIYPVQYGQDSAIPVTTENNNTYKYVYADSGDLQHIYVGRVLLTDYEKFDPTLYSWYSGGTCTSNGSWGAVGGKVGIEPAATSGNPVVLSTPVYLAAYGAYVMNVSTTSLAPQMFFKSTSICGGWTPVLNVVTDPAVEAVWYTPLLKSLGLASITWVAAATPTHRTSNPDTNEYAIHLNVGTFLGTGSARLGLQKSFGNSVIR
jgi:hypothetical protein